MYGVRCISPPKGLTLRTQKSLFPFLFPAKNDERILARMKKSRQEGSCIPLSVHKMTRPSVGVLNFTSKGDFFWIVLLRKAGYLVYLFLKICFGKRLISCILTGKLFCFGMIFTADQYFNTQKVRRHFIEWLLQTKESILQFAIMPAAVQHFWLIRPKTPGNWGTSVQDATKKPSHTMWYSVRHAAPWLIWSVLPTLRKKLPSTLTNAPTAAAP